MIRASLALAAGALASAGCAARAQTTSSPTSVSSAPSAGPTAAETAAVPSLAVTSAQDANLAAWSTPPRFAHPDAASMPSAVAGQLQSSANSRPWIDGQSYRLATSPGRVSDIMLQPGETLTAVAAGDTARWVIGDTASGSGAARRIHVLVKPSAIGLRTNLVITTDRRVYHVELESNGRSGAASLAWSYPPGEILALGAAPSDQARLQAAPEFVLEALNFGYRVEGDNPAWRPLRAFDDGRQVFIEFPAGVERREVPPLFVIGAGGASELVNYRQRGRFYVVDRLFDVAELRLGARRQQVVRITRAAAAPRGRRS